MNESELIDWLCWMWAQDGERFYPPYETAEECVDVVDVEYEDEIERAKAIGWEQGQHSRAVGEAVERFRDLESYGFDPKRRAQEYHESLQEESGQDIPDLDWTWYEKMGRKV